MNIDEIVERVGIRLDDEERERLARNLPFYEAQLAELRNISEARYLEPAVIHIPSR
ncbi:MAG: hypothetical protein ACR2IK_05470 [Chloroflexota bacterium]